MHIHRAQTGFEIENAQVEYKELLYGVPIKNQGADGTPKGE